MGHPLYGEWMGSVVNGNRLPVLVTVACDNPLVRGEVEKVVRDAIDDKLKAGHACSRIETVIISTELKTPSLRQIMQEFVPEWYQDVQVHWGEKKEDADE